MKPDKLDVRTLALEVEKRVSMTMASESLFSVEAQYHAMLDTIAFKLRAELLRFDGEDYLHPADWWQAFKERWFPWRWRQWWPVQMTRVYPRAFFPENTVPMKELERTFGIVRFDWMRPEPIEDDND